MTKIKFSIIFLVYSVLICLWFVPLFTLLCFLTLHVANLLLNPEFIVFILYVTSFLQHSSYAAFTLRIPAFVCFTFYVAQHLQCAASDICALYVALPCNIIFCYFRLQVANTLQNHAFTIIYISRGSHTAD